MEQMADPGSVLIAPSTLRLAEGFDQDLRDWGFAVAPRRHG